MENRFEEALKFVDDAVFAITGRHLKDVEVVIFRGEGQRQKYYEIAEANGYSVKYIQQDIGPKLWKILSKVLGGQFFLDKTGQPSCEGICGCRGIFVKGCPVLSGVFQGEPVKKTNFRLAVERRSARSQLNTD